MVARQMAPPATPLCALHEAKTEFAGVKGALIGTIRRSDGKLQVTYGKRPVYFYVGDRQPGQVLCQNVTEFGGLWLVVRPSGKLVH